MNKNEKLSEIADYTKMTVKALFYAKVRKKKLMPKEIYTWTNNEPLCNNQQFVVVTTFRVR